MNKVTLLHTTQTWICQIESSHASINVHSKGLCCICLNLYKHTQEVWKFKINDDDDDDDDDDDNDNNNKLANKPAIVLQDKQEKICLLIDTVIPHDLNVNRQQKTWKAKQVERPGDQGRQDVGSGDKNCARYNGCIRNNYEGMRSEPSVAPRPPVSHRAIEH